MRKAHFSRNPVAFLCLVITTCSLTVIILSFSKLPETPPVNAGQLPLKTPRNLRISENQELGFFGEMMVDMLPQDLAFTAFVPSDKAFSRDVGLKVNESWVGNRRVDVDDSTYAIVSRVLGFSVIPRRVEESDVAVGETVSYDSLSGFTLDITKGMGGDGGVLIVNGVKAERMGLKREKIVVHVMDGVIMDAQFQQSVESSDSDEDQG